MAPCTLAADRLISGTCSALCSYQSNSMLAKTLFCFFPNLFKPVLLFIAIIQIIITLDKLINCDMKRKIIAQIKTKFNILKRLMKIKSHKRSCLIYNEQDENKSLEENLSNTSMILA